LKFEENDIVRAITYLEGKDLVKVEWSIDGNFMSRITSQGIDTVEKMKLVQKNLLFISHHHKDKEIASHIKSELRDFGIDTFVAHEDINPTEEWEEVILEKLRHCNAILLLLTSNFEDSKWTDQETGFAIALNKLIIPVKINIELYEFVSRYQALSWGANVEDNLKKLIELLVDKKLISIDMLIQGFIMSNSYKEANMRSELLTEVTTSFSPEQINILADAAIKNSQINEAWDAKKGSVKYFLSIGM
jgi:hypothetical protein